MIEKIIKISVKAVSGEFDNRRAIILPHLLPFTFFLNYDLMIKKMIKIAAKAVSGEFDNRMAII